MSDIEDFSDDVHAHANIDVLGVHAFVPVHVVLLENEVFPQEVAHLLSDACIRRAQFCDLALPQANQAFV